MVPNSPTDNKILVDSENPPHVTVPHFAGFFLFVEGGNIDTAHHENKAKHALEEVVQMDRAIELATRTVNITETLLLVTADHSHGMTINGYSSREKAVTGTMCTHQLYHSFYYYLKVISKISVMKVSHEPLYSRRYR